jgi:hypothetical protein
MFCGAVGDAAGGMLPWVGGSIRRLAKANKAAQATRLSLTPHLPRPLFEAPLVIVLLRGILGGCGPITQHGVSGCARLWTCKRVPSSTDSLLPTPPRVPSHSHGPHPPQFTALDYLPRGCKYRADILGYGTARDDDGVYTTYRVQVTRLPASMDEGAGTERVHAATAMHNRDVVPRLTHDDPPCADGLLCLPWCVCVARGGCGQGW